MVNTEIRLGDLLMKNPVTTGSGTFGYGEEISEFYDLSCLGAITVKGTSLLPRLGNEYPRTVETSSGILNAIGLQNPGYDYVVEHKLPFLKKFDVPVIMNIIGQSIEDYAQIAEKFDSVDSVHALEINVSCPNVKEGCLAFGTTASGTAQVVKAVRERTKKTIITKLSPNVSDIASIAMAAEAEGSDAVSLVNTFLGTAIDPYERKFVLANKTGGLSGSCIKPIALRMVNDVYRAVKIPIVGQGGICNGLDAIEFILAGATAVSVGTSNLVSPMAAFEIINEIKEYLDTQNINDINELIGQVI